MNNRISNKSETPQIQLYHGSTNTYPVIGDVRFRRLTTLDIIIRNVVVISIDLYVKLAKEGNLTTDIHSFSFDVLSIDGTLPGRFEWRHSRGPEVKALANYNVGKENYSGDERGLKLVHARKTELPSKCLLGSKHNKVNNPTKIGGKLRFISIEQGIEEFQNAVVLSILRLWKEGKLPSSQNPILV